MHSPRPYGLLVVDGQLSERDRLFIDHEIRKFSNNKALSQLDHIRQVKDLPDGGYVIFQDMGGILKAIAHKELPIDELVPDGYAKLYVPMLYSGVITKANVKLNDGVGILITEQCRYRINNYDKDNLPKKQLYLKRFVVEINAQVVPEFMPLDSFDSIVTQYVSQKPTWYSGAMQEVMQIVGGYGKQNIKELPNNLEERAQFTIPLMYMDQVISDLDGVRLPVYTGLPPSNGQFQYDYKFDNTHAVVFDDHNKPWLTLIDKTGVWSMPLPIIPATATDAFRDYIDEVGDDEILKILDRFGGMPSGETFPDNEKDFQAWVRAGAIIKVCDTQDFYNNLSIYDGCGWSFNTSGREGFNTCYNYDNQGVKIGYSFKLKLDFTHAENHGWLYKTSVDSKYTDVVSIYLSKLFNALSLNTHKAKAIQYKLRRVEQKEIYERALAFVRSGSSKMDHEIDYWDNYVAPPIAILNGSLSKVYEGYLFHPAKFENQPQFKYPDIFLKGCLSFDFSPLQPVNKIFRCNTVMFGFYEGDSLKVVKYFYDPGTYYKNVESNFEECMIVGEWQETVTTGLTSLQGNFYTTDVDERAELAPQITTTKIKGEDKGYDSKPHFAQAGIFWRPGKLWRNRYYTHKTTINATQNNYLEVACCVPTFNRNTVVHAKRNGFSNATQSESLGLKAVVDPYSYQYWTHDPIFAWIGGLPVMNGEPYPKDGSPVWVEIENYDPSACSDFADQGPWIPNLPADYTWLIHPDRWIWIGSGGGGAPKVKKYSNTINIPGTEYGQLKFNFNGNAVDVHNNVPRTGYFLAVPSERLLLFYCDSCRVVFGDSEYVNISETDQNNRRYKWGYTSLVDHKSAYHFIGVINE